MIGNFKDSSPQKSLYATVDYKIRQGNARWDYHIRRAIETSTDLSTAPTCDFREKPQINLNLIQSKKSKSKKWVAVQIYFPGAHYIGRGFSDNLVEWEKANEEPMVDIIIKKADGSRVKKFEVPLSKLYFKYLGFLDPKKSEKTESANFLVRVPNGGGSIEVSIDAGPMFGILKVSQKLE